MGQKLSRTAISAAVTDLGWRYILGSVRGCVPVGSLAESASVAAALVAVAGAGAQDSLTVDVRPSRVVLSLRSARLDWVTEHELDLARALATEIGVRGLRLDPLPGPRTDQILEIAIDTMDADAIRPFWRAALGYVDEPDGAGALVDPIGQGPALWFQRMTEPRPQRNRIHLDISVPHDEAEPRIAAVLAAGGTLLSADEAPSFWVLGDADGNEVCVTTWQGRD